GVALILGGIVAFVLGKFATLRSVALFVGIILIGISGHVMSWLARVLDVLAGLTSNIVAWAFGVAFPGALAFILLLYLAHAWHPRNKAGRMASIAAVALAVMLTAGIAGLGLLNGVPGATNSTVSSTVGG